MSEADRLEILDLYGRYGIAFDDGDAEKWAECFTPDGRMTVVGMLDLSGREQLAEFARGLHASGQATSRHHFTTIAVDPVGEGAAGRAYALMLSGGQVVAGMSYVDELVKDDGAWRFASRMVTPQG
jgi:uncharacterized protein (TIGR02246 family)